MKGPVTGIVVLLFVLGCASGVQAGLYQFDIQSGSLSLTVEKGYNRLNLATPVPLVIGYDGWPALDAAVDYDYHVTADMGLSYSVPSLASGTASFSESLGLGIFQGIDLSEWMTSGGTRLVEDSFQVSTEYDGYTLTNALLAYHFTVANDAAANAFTLNIIGITLSQGNTPEFLGSLIPDLTMDLMGVDPSLLIGFMDLSLGITPSPGGTLDLDAAPVKAVPAPSALWLMGFGLAGLVALKRRRSAVLI